MANRLQRVLAMDEAMKARNAPTQGVQSIVNPDGTTTQLQYTEDRFGRRTVMTPEGPKVLRGYEGSNPYGNLGTGLRNIVGGLFGRTPQASKPIDYFDMSSLGPKPAETLETINNQPVIVRTQGGSVIEMIDPVTMQPIYTKGKMPAGGEDGAASKVFLTPLTDEQKKLQKFLPDGVDVRTATREQLRDAQLKSKQEYKSISDRFDKNTKAIIEVDDAMGRIIASAKNPSPSGDLALVFNYMKMLDPGSVVRESEFRTAQDAKAWLASADEEGTVIPPFVRGVIQRATEGTILLPEQRADFVQRANALYQPQVAKFDRIIASTRPQIAAAGVPEDLVISDNLMNRDFDIEELLSDASQDYNPVIANIERLPDDELKRLGNLQEEEIVKVMGQEYFDALVEVLEQRGLF